MSVQSGQDNYNRNTRPAKLAENMKIPLNKLKNYKNLKDKFANLQGINKSSPDANEQEERIVEELKS